MAGEFALVDPNGLPLRRARPQSARAQLAPAAPFSAPAGGGYDAGSRGRRLRALPSSPRAINAQIRAYGPTIVARSRYLCANNAYASRARDVFVSSAVGTGITPRPTTPDTALKTELRQLFDRWTDESDADNLTDFYGQQGIVAGEVFEAGEVFVRFRPRRASDGLSVPLQLQILPSEMLPVDGPKANLDLGNGRRIECGIEFDAIGRRVAYHFLKVHPGNDFFVAGAGQGETTQVPADEVLHIYRPIVAGQLRGLPHTTAGIATLAMLDLYDDAELERKKNAALFGAFITRPASQTDDDEHPLADQAPPQGAGDQPLPSDIPGGSIVMEPGFTVDLFEGEDVKFAEPADVGANYDPFEYRSLLRAAAGFGVPYADMTGDLRQANYGSIRAGLITFRRGMRAFQHHILVFQLCRATWRRWTPEAVLAGALSLTPARYMARRAEVDGARWIPPAWEWIDPFKDLSAAKIAVEQRFAARSQIIEEAGDDPEEVDDLIAADQQRLEARKIPPPPLGNTGGPSAGGGSQRGG